MKFKKIWNFIWNDNSFLSWVVNVILAFILVKFIIYPLLGFLLGTSFPVVAVVSCSMEHNINIGGCSLNHLEFDKWWEEQGNYYSNFQISKDQFKNYKFSNGFNKGDLMVLSKPKNIYKGDVIVFYSSGGLPIIHRFIDGKYTTKGDNNIGSRSDEININDDRLIGKALFRIPYFGWLKVFMNELLGLQ